MATRRKVGISTATSEAARRQLMQPVQCWEKVWILPSSAPAGSTVKIYKWVKTEKKQVGIYLSTYAFIIISLNTYPIRLSVMTKMRQMPH